jgi:hypothetical protein
MKSISAVSHTIKANETKAGWLIPVGKYIPGLMWAELVETDCQFLQKFMDRGASVICTNGDLGIAYNDSLAIIRIYKDYISLECISTIERKRHRKSAKKLMKLLTSVCDETKTIVRLNAVPLSHISKCFLVNSVTRLGAKPKNRIPGKDLPTWFKQFDFVKSNFKTKEPGYHMQRTPRNK